MKHRYFIAVIILATAVLGARLYYSAKPEGRMHVRFLGYTTRAVTKSGAIGYSAAMSYDAPELVRLAEFSISNGCDSPVFCSLTVRYTNGSSSFFPRDVALEPHCTTNVIGFASGAWAKHPAIQSLLVNAQTFPVPQWTNSWRLAVATAEPAPVHGLRAIRYRTALWLSGRKQYVAARWLYQRRTHEIESELIPPDTYQTLSTASESIPTNLSSAVLLLQPRH